VVKQAPRSNTEVLNDTGIKLVSAIGSKNAIFMICYIK